MMPPAPPDESLGTLRSRLDESLAARLPDDPDCPPRLREAMVYSLLGEGKRLRPLLVLLACEACGGDVEAALPAACAVEMVHAYSLIHDDLPAMDNAPTRRGRPTNHLVFSEAIAILAGDALLTRAFEILAREIRPADVATACCVELAAAAGMTGMVGGQVDDLGADSAAGRQRASESLRKIAAIHHRKTARLFCAALTLGGRVAGADNTTLTRLRTFGTRVGLAFQITDDLLDTSSQSERLGKSAGQEADRPLTYPALLGRDASRARAAELIEEACAAIAPLGDNGRRLASLARFVTTRDH